MKYDMLARYRTYLEERYSPATARTYYMRLCFLLEGQYFIENFKDIDMEKMLDRLSEIKHKNYFSQCKNAFKHFCEFENAKLDPQQLKKIKELENATRKKYRKLKVVDFKETTSKIAGLKNQKLKLSYLTMLNTGLRVFELAQLTPANCKAKNETLTFLFIGKGGKKETVEIAKNDNVTFFNQLIKHVQNTQSENHLFYSVIYLEQKANKLGFRCHDLRSIFAQLEYKKAKSIKQVMKKLRHSNIKTTKIYLKRKIRFQGGIF